MASLKVRFLKFVRKLKSSNSSSSSDNRIGHNHPPAVHKLPQHAANAASKSSPSTPIGALQQPYSSSPITNSNTPPACLPSKIHLHGDGADARNFISTLHQDLDIAYHDPSILDICRDVKFGLVKSVTIESIDILAVYGNDASAAFSSLKLHPLIPATRLLLSPPPATTDVFTFADAADKQSKDIAYISTTSADKIILEIYSGYESPEDDDFEQASHHHSSPTAVALRELSPAPSSNGPVRVPLNVQSTHTRHPPQIPNHAQPLDVCEEESVQFVEADGVTLTSVLCGPLSVNTGNVDITHARPLDTSASSSGSSVISSIIRTQYDVSKETDETDGGEIQLVRRSKELPALSPCSSAGIDATNVDDNLPSVIPATQPLGSPPSTYHGPICINDFDLIRVIGMGATGRVYEVQHKHLQAHYALKVVKDVYGRDGKATKEDQVQWLLEEQNVLKSLVDMEGFLALEASWSDAKHFYLLTALYPTDLESEICRLGYLSFERSRFYFAELTVALHTLHSLGIIHRDIKPANLMLDWDGHLIVGDFGLSSQFFFKPSVAERTYQPYYPYWATDDESREPPRHPIRTFPFVLQICCGSPPHMAPEIWLRRPHSFPVDWWAAATVLYYMLTGRLPFSGSTFTHEHELVYKIINEELAFVPGDGIDAATEDFLRRMLAKDPKKRLPILEIESHPFFTGLDWYAVRKRDVVLPYISPRQPYGTGTFHRPNLVPGRPFELGENPYPEFNFVKRELWYGDPDPVESLPEDPADLFNEIIETVASDLRPKKGLIRRLWRKFTKRTKPDDDVVFSMDSPDMFLPTARHFLCEDEVPGFIDDDDDDVLMTAKLNDTGEEEDLPLKQVGLSRLRYLRKCVRNIFSIHRARGSS